MRVKIMSEHLLWVQDGDEVGLGSITFWGPFAFIDEDRTEGADRRFFPEMKMAASDYLWRKHWRIAIFLSDRVSKWVDDFQSWRIRRAAAKAERRKS